MSMNDVSLGRRLFLRCVVGGALLSAAPVAWGQGSHSIAVWKDPNCGCCGGWVDHLRRNGFVATVIETPDMRTIKAQRQVPVELASCHAAEIAGYTIEGHVPASAIHRLLAEKPSAHGLAVPGMPIGSPGMEGGRPEEYDVMLFGNGVSKPFSRFIGDKQL